MKEPLVGPYSRIEREDCGCRREIWNDGMVRTDLCPAHAKERENKGMQDRLNLIVLLGKGKQP